MRSVVAIEKFATVIPPAVARISGSLPTFPSRMTLLTLFAMLRVLLSVDQFGVTGQNSVLLMAVAIFGPSHADNSCHGCPIGVTIDSGWIRTPCPVRKPNHTIPMQSASIGDHRPKLNRKGAMAEFRVRYGELYRECSRRRAVTWE